MRDCYLYNGIPYEYCMQLKFSKCDTIVVPFYLYCKAIFARNTNTSKICAKN